MFSKTSICAVQWVLDGWFTYFFFLLHGRSPWANYLTETLNGSFAVWQMYSPARTQFLCCTLLWKIFQPTIEKVTGSRKKCVFCFLPPNIICMIKRQMRLVTRVACIGEIRRINWMEEPFKELGTDRRLHLKDLGMDYIHVAQDRHLWTCGFHERLEQCTNAFPPCKVCTRTYSRNNPPPIIILQVSTVLPTLWYWPLCTSSDASSKYSYTVQNTQWFSQVGLTWMCILCSCRPLNFDKSIFIFIGELIDLYGPVVRVSGCRTRDPGFSSRRHQIFWEVVGMAEGVHSASWVQLRSYLEEVVEAPV
jgi:hypothetical protein